MRGADVFVSEPVAQVLQLYGDLVDQRAWERTARAQIELLAARLRDGHRRGLPGAVVELCNWLPGGARLSPQELLDRPLTGEDALETVARAHGFAGWSDAASRGATSGDLVFERAVEELLGGEREALAATIAQAPDVVGRRSHYGHGATLLHYLAANGVETYRQRVPRDAASIAALLLARGAARDATARTYGADLTTRHLLVTSGHPAAAGVTPALLAVLDGTDAAR